MEMINRDRKVAQDRIDSVALLTGTVVVGTFISLMANLIPLAIVIAAGSIYAAKRILTPAAN